MKINCNTDEIIGDKGAKIIAEFLKDNKTVRRLDISGESTGIGPDGIKEIAEALKINTTLNKLDIHINSLNLR